LPTTLNLLHQEVPNLYSGNISSHTYASQDKPLLLLLSCWSCAGCTK